MSTVLSKQIHIPDIPVRIKPLYSFIEINILPQT